MNAKVGTAQRHDSALKHVTGQALYIDDMPEPPGTLHGALVLSTVACGRLKKLDLVMAAASPGVVAISAGNYGGKLGPFHFRLSDCLNGTGGGR